MNFWFLTEFVLMVHIHYIAGQHRQQDKPETRRLARDRRTDPPAPDKGTDWLQMETLFRDTKFSLMRLGNRAHWENNRSNDHASVLAEI